MSDAVKLEAFNVQELQEALAGAGLEAYRFTRQEHRRFAARTRRGFIKERMSGRPGINWGGHGKKHAKSVGGNVRMDQKDEGSIASMRVWGKISRFLAKHETGGTITPSRAGAMAIPLPSAEARFGHLTGKVSGYEPVMGQRPFRIPNTNLLAISLNGQLIPIATLVRSVTLQARLGFRSFMRRQLPEFKARTLAAVTRGIRVAMEKRVKAIAGAIAGSRAA